MTSATYRKCLCGLWMRLQDSPTLMSKAILLRPVPASNAGKGQRCLLDLRETSAVLSMSTFPPHQTSLGLFRRLSRLIKRHLLPIPLMAVQAVSSLTGPSSGVCGLCMSSFSQLCSDRPLANHALLAG